MVNPGDTLTIDMVNQLPANPTNQRRGFFPQDPWTTNIHLHGLRVTPLGNGDNIYRLMEPGTTNQVQVTIPKDHPSGTFWYHPHKHGSVSFQLIAGLAGFLIIKGGPGTLDAVPEVAAAKDFVMGFQVIRTDLNGNNPFVYQQATQFGTNPAQQGLWSTYGLDGGPGLSNYYYTTNGLTNPVLHMRPGEVQRWRLLNAAEGENIVVALQGHGLNIIAMDGITVSNMYQLKTGAPVVIGSGQRFDVLVKAGNPGTYALQALDPNAKYSVSPSGIAPDYRTSRHSFDFPGPCSDTTNFVLLNPGDPLCVPVVKTNQKLAFPFSLATVVIDGKPMDMNLPSGPLPVPAGLPGVKTMTTRTPDAVRKVAFEICANVPNTMFVEDPTFRLPSCGFYFDKYDAAYWGGAPLNNLLMMRDADDAGQTNPVCLTQPMSPACLTEPLINFQKPGLFDPNIPLFTDMIAGNYEEWTIINRSFSDHPWHIHQNHFLVTAINGIPLSQPEWHDTIIVPGSEPQPMVPDLTKPPQPNINDNAIGSITFRTYYDPVTVGCFVAHCHIISHEDIGMMQRLDIRPAADKPSGCKVGSGQ
jgi:FtsP/CotA-like multicopper oxidase with cupredoxin domain